MAFRQSNFQKNCFAIWLCRIARSLLAMLRQPTAKQAMPFGDCLSLKKAKAIWICFIAYYMLATWR
jgi:hypothetical protein